MKERRYEIASTLQCSTLQWRIPVNSLAMREQIKIPNNQSRMERMFPIFILSEWRMVVNRYSWINRHLMNLVHIGMPTWLAGQQTFIYHSFKHLHLFGKMSKYLNGFLCRTQEGPAYTWLFNFHTVVRSLARSLVSAIKFWSLHIH